MARRKPKAAPVDPPKEELPLRLEWRSPQELAENPANWRTHPEAQVAALTDVIAEVGWAGACLYNEATGRLIDGHARKKVAIEQGATQIPVLVGRWTEEQERKILATLDPLAGMAERDEAKLDALLAEVETDSEALQALLDELRAAPPAEEEKTGAGDQTDDIKEQFQILVICKDETQQAELLAKLTAENYECRSLIS